MNKTSKERIAEVIESSISIKKLILNDEKLLATIDVLAKLTVKAFENGKRVWFCGNGGSAADAQHLASELSGRFYFDRPPLFAESLSVNTSYLTAVGNDYGFEDIFSRIVEAKTQAGDILFCLSTSGNSKNVLKAMETAHKRGVINVAFTGAGEGAMNALANFIIDIPSKDTPRIQECHMLIGHILCELVEEQLFSKK